MFEFLNLWTTLFLICVVFAFFYFYLKFIVFNYWKLHDVPHEKPTIPFGNVGTRYLFGYKDLGTFFKQSYDKFRHHRFYGIYVFNRPILVINDPEVLKSVFVKDFNKFCDRGGFLNEKVEPMGANLFFLRLKKWKMVREKLTPVFTPGKMKQIYPLMLEVSGSMIENCDAQLKHTDVFDVKDIITKYIIDVTSKLVYGCDANCFTDPNSDILIFASRAFEMGTIPTLMAVFSPELLESITLPFFRGAAVDFFNKLFVETVNYRRKEKIVRNDVVNHLMQVMDKSESEGDMLLSMSDASAQAYVFFLGGFETSTLTICYTLLELAMNPEVQEKLQQEIDKVIQNPSDFTFDNITNMEYLDMVFSETIRKYPPLMMINRICNEDYPIPDSNFVIPKGMRILVLPPGINRNPEYYPNPSKFDPTRFSKENLASRHPYTYLKFGEGPRQCIGKRLGLVQSKHALATLLYNYTFRICEDTLLPIKYVPGTIVQISNHGIYLRVERRR